MKYSTVNGIKVYRYRWIVLTVFVFISIMIALQWLTFAPIAREARLVYHVSSFQIDFLSMIFMGVFIFVCIPASYVIDTYGIRWGIGIGAVLTGIFGLMKGVFAASYPMVVTAQVGLAIAQPFIINASTRVAVQWFPIQERATAVGIATLAQFLGIITVMIATPLMVTGSPETGYNLQSAFMLYGILSVAAAVITIIFLKEKPPEAPSHEDETERFEVLKGIKHIFSLRDGILMLIIFFVGLGIFNAVSTCIDQISELKGFTTEQAGMVGGIMIITGILGAIILPPLSDKLRKRKPFLLIGIIFLVPGLMGLAIFTSYPMVLASSAVIGFFLLGAGAPIGFQYMAEISYPSPESISQGLLLFAGQVSGIIFIVGMNMFGMIKFLWAFSFLSIALVIVILFLKESKMIQEG